VVRGRDRETLHGFIRENVSGDVEGIYTDEWKAYRSVADDNTEHETVSITRKRNTPEARFTSTLWRTSGVS
jgi:hypothetical protein